MNPAVPRVFRGEESRGYEPDSVRKYESRSMVQEYRGLAIIFGIVAVGLAAYFIKSVLRAPPKPPPPIQSVYIEVVPQKSAPARDPAEVP